MAESTGNTGTRDETYNIVSVMYHALQGAETIDQYINDAGSDNQELADFLEETKNDYERIADEAKQLLMDELGNTRSESAAG